MLQILKISYIAVYVFIIFSDITTRKKNLTRFHHDKFIPYDLAIILQ